MQLVRVAPKLLAEFHTMRERESTKGSDLKDDKKKDESAVSLCCLNCIGLCVELLVPSGLDTINEFLEHLLDNRPQGTPPNSPQEYLSKHLNHLQACPTCTINLIK